MSSTTPVNSRTRTFSRACAWLWLYVIAYAVWAVVMWAGGVVRGWTNDLAFLPLYVLPTVASFQAARVRKNDPRVARGLQLVGLAWLASTAGALAWLGFKIWPARALDLAGWWLYNLYYPLTVAALWHLAELPDRGVARVRLVVESLIVLLATATLAWYFVFRFDEATRSPLEFMQTLSILFLGEVLIVFGAAVLLHRPPRRGDAAWPTLFSLGTFLVAVADFVYKHDQLIAGSWGGPTGDLLLAASAGLVATAGLLVREQSSAAPANPHRAVSLGLTLLPYLAIAVVAALLVVQFWRRDVPGPISGLVLGGAGLFVLVIGRLLVAQREFASEAAVRTA